MECNDLNLNNPDNQVIMRDENGRFKQGFSGNPAGKPLGTVDFRNRLINRLLEMYLVDDGASSYKDKLDGIYEKLIELALKGNVHAIREILDRIMGKTQQPIEREAIGGIKVRIVRSREDIEQISEA